MSWQVQCYAALLSRATGKPVKLILTKEEHLAVFTMRPASRMRAKVGCNWTALPGIEYCLQDVPRVDAGL